MTPAADPYCYPGTSVLRNNFGITDQAALDEAEARVSAVAIRRLHDVHVAGEYDLPHLQDFHRHVFGAVYPWAGDIRTVIISKAGVFCLSEHIATYADRVFSDLAGENRLRGLDQHHFARRAGHYLGEIDAIHPFREGNGRTERAFLGQLANDAGWTLDWTRVGAVDHIAAAVANLNGDVQPFINEMIAIIRPAATVHLVEPSPRPKVVEPFHLPPPEPQPPGRHR